MYGNLLLLQGDGARMVAQDGLGVGSRAGFNECWLRDRLFENPAVLPLESIDASFANSVPVCRELKTEAGSIDAVFANEHGLLTILECKLWRNPEARREVVGQVLDYAVALARLTYEDLSLKVNAALKAEGNHLFEVVRRRHAGLQEHVWVDQVSRNLSQGRFLLLVAGDGIREGVIAITEQLQRGVGLRFQFGLVEVAVYRDEQSVLTILQPRLIARTVNVERSLVRIETRIAGSQDAPPFSVAVVDRDEPAEESTDRSSDPAMVAIRREFWDHFVTNLRLEGGIDATPKRLQQNSARARLPLGQWITAWRGESIGKIGVWFEARGDQAAEISRLVEMSRTEIEAEIGLPVQWDESGSGQVLVSASREESDFENPEALAAQHAWLADHLKAFTRVLGPRLRRIEQDLERS